jgi:hypothetical protein
MSGYVSSMAELITRAPATQHEHRARSTSTEHLSLYLQPLHHLRQPLPRHSERGGSARALPVRTGQCGTHEPPLELLARGLESAERCGCGLGEMTRKRRRPDSASARRVDRDPCDDVLQFAHIARPVVARERRESVGRERRA